MTDDRSPAVVNEMGWTFRSILSTSGNDKNLWLLLPIADILAKRCSLVSVGEFICFTSETSRGYSFSVSHDISPTCAVRPLIIAESALWSLIVA